MQPLALHEFHRGLHARFEALSGAEAVADYGDVAAEYSALRRNAAALDLSFRSRICLTGADRARFLHGQTTNDIKRLRPGQGCYAALVTAKGKMQSDLNVYCLADELLLDFEPGLANAVAERFEKYIVADDVQIVDVAPLYGLLSVQGPQAAEAIRRLEFFGDLPARAYDSVKAADSTLGELYLMQQSRSGSAGFDLFVPMAALGAVADKLIAAVKGVGGRAAGWSALELARIESGIPRFGADMDETNLPLECGIEERAVSYQKGCYIGQEVINRVHTIGHVNRELRGLRLPPELTVLPVKGDKLFHDGKEAGQITSVVRSPGLNANLALGYVRREMNAPGTRLIVRTAAGEIPATVAALPFHAS